MPALRHLQGRLLDQVTDALDSPVAKERGLFRPEYIEELRAAPNEHGTPVGYNKLWQLGLLELWLQTHGIS